MLALLLISDIFGMGILVILRYEMVDRKISKYHLFV